MSLQIKSSSLHDYPRKLMQSEDVAVASEAEACITKATDKKPIVATFGCMSCVALGGFDPTNQIAFIAHFWNSTQSYEFRYQIILKIKALAKKELVAPVQLHLRGGVEQNLGSREIVSNIKEWVTRSRDLALEIVSMDILANDYSGKSLFIDSRNGTVGQFEPLSQNQFSKGEKTPYYVKFVYNPTEE